MRAAFASAAAVLPPPPTLTLPPPPRLGKHSEHARLVGDMTLKVKEFVVPATNVPGAGPLAAPIRAAMLLFC